MSAAWTRQERAVTAGHAGVYVVQPPAHACMSTLCSPVCALERPVVRRDALAQFSLATGPRACIARGWRAGTCARMRQHAHARSHARMHACARILWTRCDVAPGRASRARFRRRHAAPRKLSPPGRDMRVKSRAENTPGALSRQALLQMFSFSRARALSLSLSLLRPRP